MTTQRNRHNGDIIRNKKEGSTWGCGSTACRPCADAYHEHVRLGHTSKRRGWTIWREELPNVAT